jgi:hypothetical protein
MVHRFVLEDREYGFCPIEQRMPGAFQIRAAQGVEHTAIRLFRERVHFVA